jgi:hypothetical protein
MLTHGLHASAINPDAPTLNGDLAPCVAQFGDANVDGLFDPSDIVQVLQTGKYLSNEPATWGGGDWNGDNVFDQKDIIAALQLGDYLEQSGGVKVGCAAIQQFQSAGISLKFLSAISYQLSGMRHQRWQTSVILGPPACTG